MAAATSRTEVLAVGGKLRERKPGREAKRRAKRKREIFAIEMEG